MTSFLQKDPPASTFGRVSPSSRLPLATGPRALGAAALAALLLVASGPVRADISHSQKLKAETFEKMSKGIKAYHDGKTKEAIDLLTQVATVALNSFRAHYYLGLAYEADRQYKKAIEPLTFALDLDPTHMQAHVDLGDCYLKRGDIGEALAEYNRALEVQQNFAPAYDGLGRAAEASGDDDKAIEEFKKAIDLNPGFPGGPLNLGDLYLRRGRLREAVDLFLQAIAVRPDFAAAYNRLGVAYSRQRLGNEAIAALRKASELEPGNPWHPYTIGLIQRDMGYTEGALRSFEDAIRLDANYLEAYVAKAGILRQLGRFEEAEYLLDAASQRPSEDVKLKHDITELREKYRRERLTIDDIEARMKQGQASPDEIRTLAGLRAETGDYASAARALASVVDPNAPPADLFRLGYYQLRAGQYDEAVDSFTALRGERPGSAAVLLDLGLSLQGKGLMGAAEQVYVDAVGRSPDDPILLTALGNALVENGKYEEAARYYEKALASPTEFDGRARVETILKAIRQEPADDGGAPSAEVRRP